MKTTYFQVGDKRIPVKKAPPTRRHRLAIAPGILGTVYAINEQGEARYFDYDREGAYAFAGVSVDRDPRFSTAPGGVSYVRSGATECNPRPGTRCLWILKEER